VCGGKESLVNTEKYNVVILRNIISSNKSFLSISSIINIINIQSEEITWFCRKSTSLKMPDDLEDSLFDLIITENLYDLEQIPHLPWEFSHL
jgi:hypothetical protein